MSDAPTEPPCASLAAPVTRKPDIIRSVINRMLAHGVITEELALRCEREARAEWGGQRIDYVAKHSQADRDAPRPVKAPISRARVW